MSKIFKKPMISNDTISLDSNEWSEIAIELNIKNSQENIHNFGNCNNKLPEFHGKDYLMLSKDLPKLDEKAVSKIEKHDKMIKEKEFFDQKTQKPGTPGILPPKANRNGHALLKYFLSCGYEFALNEGIPYFYFDETGVWYPLTTLGGSCRFMSTFYGLFIAKLLGQKKKV